MQDKPDAFALLAQVESDLRRGLAPGFAQRVAANAVALCLRELERKPDSDALERERLRQILAHDGSLELLNAELCEAIRGGRMTLSTPGVAAHLQASVREKMLIDQPAYPAFRSRSGEGEKG